MQILDAQMDHLIDEYKVYVEKIIAHTYYRVDSEAREELRHVGLIGLWKGIIAYYKREAKEFDRKEFVDTICAYIRYEMVHLLRERNVIKISGNQWRNYTESKKIIAGNPNASEEALKCLLKESGLRYDWYLKVTDILHIASLDAGIGAENESNKYNLVRYSDHTMKRFFDMAYIEYIIHSALAGVKLERDRKLIQTWIDSVYNGFELTQTQLAQIYNISPSMTGVILSRFIDICRFVRTCDKAFHRTPRGCIHFPEIKASNTTNKKIPGVKWVLRNRKWKVEITVGKKSSIFIGYFENYEDAVHARQDAEIQYRGKSDIIM